MASLFPAGRPARPGASIRFAEEALPSRPTTMVDFRVQNRAETLYFVHVNDYGGEGFGVSVNAAPAAGPVAKGSFAARMNQS